MKNLLVFAHRKEAESFFENYDFKKIDFVFDNLFESQDFYLLISGEGLQNTTEKLATVLSSMGTNISLVCNLGVVGALNTKLKKMDIIEIRTVYAKPFEEVEFKSFSTNSKSSIDCISTNSRIFSKESKEKLAFYADVVDRELWAIGSVSNLFKKEFSSIKIISDEVNDENFCQTIIDESRAYSDKLFKYFIEVTNQKIEKSQKKEFELFKNKNFHLSVTQKRQYENLMNLLSAKIDEEKLFISEFFKELTLKEIPPKQRSKELLGHLIILLNPHHKQYYDRINTLINKITKNGIQVNYDQSLEDSNIEIIFKTNNSIDLSHKISIISTLPINEIQKVFNGELDV